MLNFKETNPLYICKSVHIHNLLLVMERSPKNNLKLETKSHIPIIMELESL